MMVVNTPRQAVKAQGSRKGLHGGEKISSEIHFDMHEDSSSSR